MRVSTLVKDYVRKEVKKAYEDELNSIGVEYEAEVELVKDEVQKILDEAIAKANKVMEEHNMGCYRYRAYGDDVFYNGSGAICNPEIEEVNREKREEIKNKIEATIEEILLTLELGGTKADLERMLSEIHK